MKPGLLLERDTNGLLLERDTNETWPIIGERYQ